MRKRKPPRPPQDRNTLRPWRIFDPAGQIRGRWYGEQERACKGALVLCYEELQTGRTLEVLNTRSMTLWATFTKTKIGNIVCKDREQLREEERRK
jgi:hypothetical protein